MEQSMHITVNIPVTITQCKKNREIERKKNVFFCGHDDHVGYIYKIIQ